MSAYVNPSLTNSQLGRRAVRRRKGWLGRLVTTLRLWLQRAEQRRALAELTPRELADFGASTADVYRELRTPIWRSLPPC
jgi:uncharacterized protein YjiS (DUF1127 family)